MVSSTLAKSFLAIILVVIVVTVGAVVYNNLGYIKGDGTAKEVILLNNSEYVIGSGVIVIHNDNFSLNFISRQTSEEIRGLAAGSPQKFVSFVEKSMSKGGVDFVYTVFTTQKIPSKTRLRYPISTKLRGSRVSVLVPIITGDDSTLAFIDSQPIYDKNQTIRKTIIDAQILNIATPSDDVANGTYISHHETVRNNIIHFELLGDSSSSK